MINLENIIKIEVATSVVTNKTETFVTIRKGIDMYAVSSDNLIYQVIPATIEDVLEYSNIEIIDVYPSDSCVYNYAEDGEFV